MEEAQADLLFDNQTKLFDHVPSKKDLADMQTSIQVQQTNLRHEYVIVQKPRSRGAFVI